MQGQRAPRQDREVQAGDEQRDGRQAPLAHDLRALRPDLLQGDLHPRARLVLRAQDQERVVRVARVVESQQGHGAADLEAVHEAHHEVRLALQRPAYRPELAVDRLRVARGGVEQADARQPVEVVVDGLQVAHEGRNRIHPAHGGDR